MLLIIVQFALKLIKLMLKESHLAKLLSIILNKDCS